MIAAFTMVYGGEEDEPMVGGKDMSSIKPVLDLSLPETQILNQFLPCQIAPDNFLDLYPLTPPKPIQITHSILARGAGLRDGPPCRFTLLSTSRYSCGYLLLRLVNHTSSCLVKVWCTRKWGKNT